MRTESPSPIVSAAPSCRTTELRDGARRLRVRTAVRCGATSTDTTTADWRCHIHPNMP